MSARTLLMLLLTVTSAGAAEPIAERWDYAAAMQQVAGKFQGRPGVVLHVGDSITYSNPYGQWARFGEGRSDEDRATLAWMHAGKDDDTDGWWLARFDHPAGGRSYTACSGIRLDEMLAGGKQQMPPLKAILDQYKPQMIVLMLGTNDASQGRDAKDFAADLAKAAELATERGIIGIFSTIPPHPHKRELAAAYNVAIRELAKARSLPLIDYEQEILTRRPDDWNGTLLGKDDVHPSANFEKATPASAPTDENLRSSGYLLRGWLSVKKIGEVRRRVLDARAAAPALPQPEVAAVKGESIRVPIVRDTYIASIPEEELLCFGGSTRLRLKSYQYIGIVDIDPAPLRGREIKAATLHVRNAADWPLKRVTVGTVRGEWVEGESSGQDSGDGANFRFRGPTKDTWGTAGGDLTAAILGQSGSIWRMADATPPDAEGWQHIPVDAAVVAERAAGRCHGLVVFDDTGNEWQRDGEKFTRTIFPNRGFYSREQSNSQPYLTVTLGEPITDVPQPVEEPAATKPPAEKPFEVAPLPEAPASKIVKARPAIRVPYVLAFLDELDKVDRDGKLVGRYPATYLESNHICAGPHEMIRLQAARNEFVAFQIWIGQPVKDLSLEVTFYDGATDVHVELAKYVTVESPAGPLADPLVPIEGPITSDVPCGLHVELYVPHSIKPGQHRGHVLLKSKAGGMQRMISLEVHDFTLPDYLSFLPEMNCYDLPANELDYYRLAHRHRTVINRVPYYQSGQVAAGCAPDLLGEQFEWSKWDARFAKYFDGSDFADLPRKGVPLEVFYLPLCENWPAPIEPNYNGDYWADRAFTASYRAKFVEASRQFAEHLNQRGWHDTLFHCFFNGKQDFKQNGWSRASSPWLLDEPASFQDFWALRYFGQAFHEGASAARGQARLLFRADISRPEWQRDSLNGLLDYNVVAASELARHGQLVFDRQRATGELVVGYGTANAVEQSNVQPVAWSLDMWLLGCDGLVPWQTIGTAESWKTGEATALFYPHPEGEQKPPVPSVRLKAFRRGQQDVEYLTLLAQLEKQPREAVGEWLRRELQLASRSEGTGTSAAEDAGRLRYDLLSPADLARLRARIAATIEKHHPPFARRLVELKTPPRDAKALPERYVSTMEARQE